MLVPHFRVIETLYAPGGGVWSLWLQASLQKRKGEGVGGSVVM